MNNNTDTNTINTNSTIKLGQINTNRCKDSTHTVHAYATQNNIDILTIQEPYTTQGKASGFPLRTTILQSQSSNTNINKTSIVILNNNIIATQLDSSTPNITVARLDGLSVPKLHLFSFYSEPETAERTPSHTLQELLGQISDIILHNNIKHYIICGDFNAKSTLWGSPGTDGRGRTVEAFLSTTDSYTLNCGSSPTFQTCRGESHVDLTICSASMHRYVHDWRVDDAELLSDHNLLQFHLSAHRPLPINNTTYKYKTNRADWVRFDDTLRRALQLKNMHPDTFTSETSGAAIEGDVNTFLDTLTDVCDRLFVKKSPSITNDRAQPPWWTAQLTTKRNHLTAAKRLVYRTTGAALKRLRTERYKALRREYQTLLKDQKRASWRRFCDLDPRCPFGSLYKLVKSSFAARQPKPQFRNVDGQLVEDDSEAIRVLHHHFFDTNPSAGTNLTPYAPDIQIQQDIPKITFEELDSIIKYLPNKAPGPDCFTSEIVKRCFQYIPSFLINLYNACLTARVFPTRWKEANVVFIPKPGKTPNNPTSLRPICLIPIFGKIYERVLLNRLNHHLNNLPPHLKPHDSQYGFIKGKSTEQACHHLVSAIQDTFDKKQIMVAFSLDISHAFDRASHVDILTKLHQKRCSRQLIDTIAHYFTDRTVNLTHNDAAAMYDQRQGCPQGSVLGPALWNLIMDDLLSETLPPNAEIVAYADDVLLLTKHNNSTQITQQTTQSLDIIERWASRHGMTFNPCKTQAVLFTKKRKHSVLPFTFMGERIPFSPSMRYLGLTIDKRLSWTPHLTTQTNKAKRILNQLNRISRNTWGAPSGALQTIYKGAIAPILLYNCSVWSKGMRYSCNRAILQAAQRSVAIRIAKAYHTVSHDVALVLAQLEPLTAKVDEISRIYVIKNNPLCQIKGKDCKVDLPIKLSKKLPPFEVMLPSDHIFENETIGVYTDGSKHDGKVGAAFCVFEAQQLTYTRKIKMGNYCSVYQAELLAIKESLEFISDRFDHFDQSAPPTINIYTDSLSAKNSVFDVGSRSSLTNKIHQKLVDLHGKSARVSLTWVKGHSGIGGNELADHHAKLAAASRDQPVYNKIPLSHLKQNVIQDTVIAQKNIFNNISENKILKSAFDDFQSCQKFIKHCKPDWIAMQFLSGHGKFNTYLYRFLVSDTNTCQCHLNTNQSPEHLLLECPIMWAYKSDLMRRLRADGIYDPPTLDNLFSLKYFKYTKNILHQIHNRLNEM